MVNNSIGTNMFRNFYADFDGTRRDTMQDGEVSGAFFVSSILTIFNAIKKPSSTVESVIANMQEAGWEEVDNPEAGDVLVWEKIVVDGEEYPQIGFYVGEDMAISVSSKMKSPFKHDWKYRDYSERSVTTIYRGKHLMPDDIKEI
jgi:hypothetical protein